LSEYTYDIDVVGIVRTTQNWHQAGVIGAANVKVDGKSLEPIFLVRGIDGVVLQYMSFYITDNLPMCALDAKLRKHILMAVDEEIQANDEGE